MWHVIKTGRLRESSHPGSLKKKVLAEESSAKFNKTFFREAQKKRQLEGEKKWNVKIGPRASKKKEKKLLLMIFRPNL